MRRPGRPVLDGVGPPLPGRPGQARPGESTFRSSPPREGVSHRSALSCSTAHSLSMGWARMVILASRAAGDVVEAASLAAGSARLAFAWPPLLAIDVSCHPVPSVPTRRRTAWIMRRVDSSARHQISTPSTRGMSSPPREERSRWGHPFLFPTMRASNRLHLLVPNPDRHERR
jgi:hypothetical protein